MAKNITGWNIYARNGHYWVRWPDGKSGKVRQRLVDEHGKKLNVGAPPVSVRKAAALLYAEWCRNAEKETPGNETIAKLTGAYVGAHEQNWGMNTVKNYSLYMRELEGHFGADHKAKLIKAHHCEELKQALFARIIKKDGTTLGTRSVKDRFEFYHSLWEWCIRMDYLESNPFRKITEIKVTRRYKADPFNQEETALLLATAKTKMKWFYPVVLTAAITGSRRGPFRDMLVGDFDEKKRTLTARPEISKGGRGVEYRLPNFLVRELSRITEGRGPTELLFLNHKGRKLATKIFDKPERVKNTKRIPPHCRAWYRLQTLAGVRVRPVHNLRRAAVSNLAEADVTMEKIVEVTGQTPEIAREHYLKLSSEAQRQTMEKLGGLYGISDHDEEEEGEGEEEASAPSVPTPGTGVQINLSADDARLLADHLDEVLKKGTKPLGTKVGTNGKRSGLKPSVSTVGKNMADRVGFEPTLGG